MINNNNFRNIIDCKNKIINILYPQFEFEYDITKQIEICNVKISITTILVNENKITSYINKSSNINQSLINMIFNVLQMRYILLDDTKRKI